VPTRSPEAVQPRPEFWYEVSHGLNSFCNSHRDETLLQKDYGQTVQKVAGT
jgi:hypothetical protein